MNHWLSIAALSTALSLAASPPSQVRPGVFGYLVTGQNGTAGEFCWQVDCSPRPLRVNSGETITLQVNAPFQNFFAIGASFSATSCVAIPGVENRLVLDPTIVTLALGVISQSSPILACWGGTETVSLPLPNGLPTGLTIATQAVAVVPSLSSPNAVALSVAVAARVQ